MPYLVSPLGQNNCDKYAVLDLKNNNYGCFESIEDAGNKIQELYESEEEKLVFVENFIEASLSNNE